MSRDVLKWHRPSMKRCPSQPDQQPDWQHSPGLLLHRHKPHDLGVLVIVRHMAVQRRQAMIFSNQNYSFWSHRFSNRAPQDLKLHKWLSVQDGHEILQGTEEVNETLAKFHGNKFWLQLPQHWDYQCSSTYKKNIYTYIYIYFFFLPGLIFGYDTILVLWFCIQVPWQYSVTQT